MKKLITAFLSFALCSSFCMKLERIAFPSGYGLPYLDQKYDEEDQPDEYTILQARASSEFDPTTIGQLERHFDQENIDPEVRRRLLIKLGIGHRSFYYNIASPGKVDFLEERDYKIFTLALQAGILTLNPESPIQGTRATSYFYEGDSFLQYAIRHGKARYVALLLQHGSRIDYRNPYLQETIVETAEKARTAGRDPEGKILALLNNAQH